MARRNYLEGRKMNFANTDWMAIFINWFPMLLIFGVWVFFLRQMKSGKGLYSNQRRIADALERIADAMEKRH
jgi:ATP-dependent Zn protease